MSSRTIEVTKEQRVIDSSLYARMRHPMNSGMPLLYLTQPIVHGSEWALLLLVLFPFGIEARIRNEEKVALRDLKSYSDYTQGTRWRLIPCIS